MSVVYNWEFVGSVIDSVEVSLLEMWRRNDHCWTSSHGSESESCERRKKTKDSKFSISGFSSFSSTSILIIILSLLSHQLSPTHGAVNSPPLITKQPPTDTIFFQVAQRVDENDKPFIIECEAEGYPESQYRWIKNGKDFKWQAYDDRISQQPGRGTLVVTAPRDEDIGQYQCFAYNSFGTATSNSVFLRKAELSSFKDDTLETLVAEEGKPFDIPCNAPDGWPKPRVDWMFQTPNGAIKNINSSRITVDPEGTLRFSNVTQSDMSTEFTYACSAYSSFRNEYKLGNRIFLSVNPTSSSSVQNKVAPYQQYMTKKGTVAIRGQALELWCIVGGTPLPEIRWSRTNGRMPYERVEYDNYGKTLRILNVDTEDAGSYDCDASNGVGVPVSYSIGVKIEAAPYFTVEPEVINAAEDESIEFRCEAKGEPSPIIKWIHNGKPIEEAPPNPRRSLEGPLIVFRNLLKSDTGNYGCNASNSLGYVYKDVYINVLAMPAEITEGPKDAVVMEGKDAMMTCRVFGAPRPLVRWLKNEIELTGGRYKVLGNGDLQIDTVSFSDAGAYNCFASNKLGNATSSGKLIVKTPTRIIDGPENYQVTAGNPVKFGCTAVSDDTLPLQIEWLNDGAPIDFDSEPRYVKLQDNSLTIDKTTELDSGLYTCLAKTEYDNITANATLIVQEVPNQPRLLSVECRPRDAAVRWKAMGDNRAPILHYIIQFNTSFTPESWEIASKDVPATESSYTVSMKPWANYTFRVIAKNSIGASPASDHSDVCTTSEDVPFTNPENVKADKAEPRSLRITWTPMSEIDHNAPKFKYEVQWKEDDEHHAWRTETIHDWKTNEFIIPNQPIYRPYLIKVRAINEKGQSNVAPTIVRGYSGQDTPTQAPSNFTLVTKISAKRVLVSWDPVSPESLQGKFEGYKIETWTDADGEDVYRPTIVNYDVTKAVVDKLIPFSRNYFRVFAFNSDHQGPYSTILDVITDEGTPGPVEDLEVRPLGVSSLHLKWNKPEQPNGILLGYQIKYASVNGTEVKWNELNERLPNISHPEIVTAKLAGLKADTVYRVYVAAMTKEGAGEESFVEERTFAENATMIAKPDFQWDHEQTLNGLAAVRVSWKPNFEASGRPGSHFFVQYREYGRTKWNTAEEVFNEDFDVIRGLEPGLTYIFRVVAVDGIKSMPSDEQEIYTYAIDAPTIRAKAASSTTGWFIGLIVAIAFLVLILILVCIIKRNRGGKYAVYEREIAHGRLDYDEGGFREYAQAPSEEPTGRTPMVSDFKPPHESDSDSMVEYGEEGKFTEDGSFIGQYGVKKKDPNLPSPLATFV